MISKRRSQSLTLWYFVNENKLFRKGIAENRGCTTIISSCMNIQKIVNLEKRTAACFYVGTIPLKKCAYLTVLAGGSMNNVLVEKPGKLVYLDLMGLLPISREEVTQLLVLPRVVALAEVTWTIVQFQCTKLINVQLLQLHFLHKLFK